MLSEVAVEPKVAKPAKSAKQPETTVIPPKDEPAKKGTTSVCADSFFRLTSLSSSSLSSSSWFFYTSRISVQILCVTNKYSLCVST